MEKRGIPTVVVQRQEFVGATKNAVAGFGFLPDVAMVVFPVGLFLVGSDLAPIGQKMDLFIQGLTRWKPSTQETKNIDPPAIEIRGKDFEENFPRMNRLFLSKRWGDGLPLLPPTEERLKWILRGTDLPPDTRIGKILPLGRIATVKTVAVALAMAGGRPEYLPLLIATVEAVINPALSHQSWQATSSSVYPAVIVNGPVARQVRLNSGFGLLGPDALHPAGGLIGRALRLLLQNVGGAVPGVGTMSQFGGMRYTNAVFAEDEDGLPPGWEPLSVEYFGIPRGANSLAVCTVSSAVNITRRGTGKETPEEEALGSLYRIAAYMEAPNVNGLRGYDEGAPGILLLSSTAALQLANLGWTKDKIKGFLWENSRIPVFKLKQTGMLYYLKDRGMDPETLPDPWPITRAPRNIMIVVAGGRHPTQAYWMQGAQGPKTVSARIHLPAGWEELLKEADADMGPAPAE
jgi:hypothetical protein